MSINIEKRYKPLAKDSFFWVSVWFLAISAFGLYFGETNINMIASSISLGLGIGVFIMNMVVRSSDRLIDDLIGTVDVLATLNDEYAELTEKLRTDTKT